MTDKAKELLEDLKSQTNKILLDLVAENEELEGRLACLIDRPCSVCKFHTERGCAKWACVFEEKPNKEHQEKEDEA